MFNLLKFFTVLSMVIFLSSCQTTPNGKYFEDDGPPSRDIHASSIADITPKAERKSRKGNAPSYRVRGKRYHVMRNANGYQEVGTASWYGKKFHGRLTSNGEKYNMFSMTAAHKALPLPTYLKVTNLKNNKNTIVRVNDRGPFIGDRIIDLSYAAAKKLGFSERGTAKVHLEQIDGLDSSEEYAYNYTTEDQPNPIYEEPNNIFLQVGAFSELNNAVSMQKNINTSLALSAAIEKGFVNEQTIYKVQVGPFNNVEDSDKSALKLVTAGYSEPISIMR